MMRLWPSSLVSHPRWWTMCHWWPLLRACPLADFTQRVRRRHGPANPRIKMFAYMALFRLYITHTHIYIYIMFFGIILSWYVTWISNNLFISLDGKSLPRYELAAHPAPGQPGQWLDDLIPCDPIVPLIPCLVSEDDGSLDWFKGKSTGNHGFYH